MKRLIACGGSLGGRQPSCASCRHFCDSPQQIESQLPGMRSLGSAHASVRASDGLCLRHQRYLPASSDCPQYERRTA